VRYAYVGTTQIATVQYFILLVNRVKQTMWSDADSARVATALALFEKGRTSPQNDTSVALSSNHCYHVCVCVCVKECGYVYVCVCISMFVVYVYGYVCCVYVYV
jgi:hypothetical protein